MSERTDPGPGAPAAPRRSPLLRAAWRYVERTSLDDFEAADWALMNRQRAEYNGEEIARQTLRMLVVTRDDPTFGYLVNPTSRVMTRSPIEPRENTRRSPRTFEAV